MTESTFKRACDEGKIPCERTPGGHRRIKREWVESYLRGEYVGTV